jgi:DNA mismatch repair protein MutL
MKARNMPPRIRILPENLANKIAAGEVVERPASVAKELIENSLDAGATEIRLETSSGGRKLIRIVDNGHGMSREDALLAIERHATSKIIKDADLDMISTLGFRGEALPSIASVSRLCLKSRESGSIEGSEIYLEGGRVKSVNACGMATGTEITVENLFFNTPARMKFMRSAETEAAHLADLVTRMAISRPDVAFSYIQDGKELIRVAPGDLKQRFQKLAARQGELFELGGASDAASLSGFFGPPDAARSTSGTMFTYINGRFVRDKVVQHAIMQAFRPVLERGRYPLLALFIQIPPGDLDVNVHPTKHEVRFRRQSQVHETIHGVLSEALSSSPWLKSTAPARRPSQPIATPSAPQTYQAGVQQALDRFINQERSAPSLPKVHETAPDYPKMTATQEQGYFSSLTVIGQFQAAYILCQGDNELVIIDQHAAAERVRFEQLKTQWRKGHVESQHLLIPETVELSYGEAEAANRFKAQLNGLGIELEEFGGRTYQLTAFPAIARGTDPARLVRDILADLEAIGSESRFEQAVDELLAQIACHSVIRGTHALDHQQIRALLAQMDQTDFSAHCPHGRPVSSTISLREMEKLFKRT